MQGRFSRGTMDAGIVSELGLRAPLRGAIFAGAVFGLSLLSALTLGAPSAQATFPGTNGRIACEFKRPGQANPDIYTMNPDGSDARFVTLDGSQNFNPKWSADGKRLAFQSIRFNAADIYTVNSDGTNILRVTAGNDAALSSPSFSPSGARIVYSALPRAFAGGQANNQDIFTTNADGSGDKRRLTTADEGDQFPEYSPDGTKIAFRRGFPRPPDQAFNDVRFFVMNADGTGEREVFRTTATVPTLNPPRWSPDGTRLVTASIVDGDFDVVSVNVDGTDVRNLTNSPDAGDDRPFYAPDGTRIAFASDRGTSGARLWSMNPDGSDQRIQVFGSSPTGNDCNDWQAIPRGATSPPVPPSGGGFPLPPGGGGAGSVPSKATVCANSAGVRVIGRTNSGGRVIQGTNGNNRICGTSAGDVITGNGGRDVISGGGGNDRINGGSGSDRVNGGSGKDRISGSSGNDSISGSSGNDRINGNSGTDRITGASGNDRLNGSTGNDVVSGSSGRDVISGSSGSDRLSGNSGRDRINGNSGNDRISGGSGNDRLKGGSGNDRIDGGAGRDRISGGSGRDKVKQ